MGVYLLGKEAGLRYALKGLVPPNGYRIAEKDLC